MQNLRLPTNIGGGGFVVKEERINAKKKIAINVLFLSNYKATELLDFCHRNKKKYQRSYI
jgi:L-serine dehydratase